MKEVTLVTTVHYRDRTFLITKDENGYWGIEDKYYSGGQLIQEFNGITGHLFKELHNTIHQVLLVIEAEYLISTGMTRDDAVIQAFRNIHS